MNVEQNEPVSQPINEWLPPLRQVLDALQFRLDGVIGSLREPVANSPAVLTDSSAIPISMRQGFGLVVSSALLAGLLPFACNWFAAGQSGVALPVLQWTQAVDARAARLVNSPWPMQGWVEAAHTIAGLEPRTPGWLAAGVSSLGVWLNQPLHWVTCWLVYGLGILLVCKAFGATTTLQRFYAATSYAYPPLLLTMLQPIPYLGPLATLFALLWLLILYTRTIQQLTGLALWQAALSVLLPGGLAVLLALIVLGVAVISLVQLIW